MGPKNWSSPLLNAYHWPGPFHTAPLIQTMSLQGRHFHSYFPRRKPRPTGAGLGDLLEAAPPIGPEPQADLGLAERC